MRSSQKSGRSRGKGNRNKNVGHSPNRVYESAGPEGKVRGTPQQIIDKYLALARDAQLSGDRVGAENFLQHAEHYSRILIAAQEAADQRRDQQQQANQGGQSEQSGAERRDARGEDDDDGQRQGSKREAVDESDQPPSDGLGTIDAATEGPEIVETPESKSKPSRPRRPRPRRPEGEASSGETPAAETAE